MNGVITSKQPQTLCCQICDGALRVLRSKIQPCRCGYRFDRLPADVEAERRRVREWLK